MTSVPGSAATFKLVQRPARRVSRLGLHQAAACLALSAAFLISGCGSSPARESISTVRDADGVASESRFREIIEEVVSLYRPDMEQAGAFLRLSVQWADPEFRAYSAKSNQTWLLMLSGGLVQNTWSTEDGLRAIVCHEMGHFFGGAPEISPGLAAEGQADFFAAGQCLPRLWRDGDNSESPPTERNPVLPDSARATCATPGSGDPADAALCTRILRAAWVAMNTAAQRRSQPSPSYESSDDHRTDQTIVGYPSYQCRLDTYRAGVAGSARPACWFRAEE